MYVLHTAASMNHPQSILNLLYATISHQILLKFRLDEFLNFPIFSKTNVFTNRENASRADYLQIRQNPFRAFHLIEQELGVV